MPIEYTVSPDGKFVYAVATGVLKPDEIYRYVHETAEDERIEPGHREIFDVREILESEVSPESFDKIRELIIASPKRKQSNKLAIVVRKSSSFYNARRFESMVRDGVQNVIVFNDIHTAKVWLGVNDMEIERTTASEGTTHGE